MIPVYDIIKFHLIVDADMTGACLELELQDIRGNPDQVNLDTVVESDDAKVGTLVTVCTFAPLRPSAPRQECSRFVHNQDRVSQATPALQWESIPDGGTGTGAVCCAESCAERDLALVVAAQSITRQ